MFSISLNQCGKSFNRHWLFQDLSGEFKTGEKWAILGPNGSGKSTLTLLLCGQILPTKGNIIHTHQQQQIPLNQLHRYVALASPALELNEDLNTKEIFDLHAKLKPMQVENAVDVFTSLAGYGKAVLSKPIATFSSGMKQRVKLSLALMSDTPLLLLDEPFTNLDKAGEGFVRELMESFGNDRLIFIASNREEEYEGCSHRLTLESGS